MSSGPLLYELVIVSPAPSSTSSSKFKVKQRDPEVPQFIGKITLLTAITRPTDLYLEAFYEVKGPIFVKSS
jgi:hypothetical protein